MATLIRSSGERLDLIPANDLFECEELQRAVGGYIDMLTLPDSSVLVFNDDGKLIGLPYNEEATRLARLAGIMPSDYVVGDVVLCSERELD